MCWTLSKEKWVTTETKKKRCEMCKIIFWRRNCRERKAY